ncbi:MAG: DUF177 domain-containing protein [Bacteriovoracia bacterium]
MKIYLHELSEELKTLDFTEKDAWLIDAIAWTWETVEVSNVSTKKDEIKKKVLPHPIPTTLHLEMRKSQDVIFLKGDLVTKIGLYCSRCANPIEQPISAHFQCLFTKDPTLGGVDHHKKTSGNSTGIAYSEPTGTTEEDIDIEFLEKDYIELADVLKEQIYLKVPFQPLCKESCKGICPVCGQDQNLQPCQCHRIKNPALANALKNVLSSNHKPQNNDD